MMATREAAIMYMDVVTMYFYSTLMVIVENCDPFYAWKARMRSDEMLTTLLSLFYRTRLKL